ncbi:hypothetical protein PMAYCL1PPCAC_10907, partial [Pristionchus mayeri]
FQRFYNRPLKMYDVDLSNFTWDSIVQSICNRLNYEKLFLHDSSISTDDINQRILRYENYTVALVKEDLLPPLLSLPILGEVRFWQQQLKKSLEWVFFRGFCSPFKNSSMMQDEFIDKQRKEEIAERLEKVVTYLAISSMVLSPIIFLYKSVYHVFTAADLRSRESSTLSSGAYTAYGRYRVRHFNQLDHELNQRLNRSHASATAYLAQFSSKQVAVFARKISFIAKTILAVLSGLAVWDEDVLQI